MTSEKVMMRLGDLVIDDSFYPRSAVNAEHVDALASAYQTGAKLPPIVADAATKKIVDGRHRFLALQRLKGMDASVPVELRGYQNLRQMFMEAIEITARHGLRFSVADVHHLVKRAEDLRIDSTMLASALCLTKERLSALALKPAPQASGIAPTGPAARPSWPVPQQKPHRPLRPLPATIKAPATKETNLSAAKVAIQSAMHAVFTYGLDLRPLRGDLETLDGMIRDLLDAMNSVPEVPEDAAVSR